VTWLQFNAQLLRLTGEKRFADQIEKTVLNQLMGAQSCDGTKWGYYVQMEGRKPYTNNLDGNCCLSSGPRGVALVATFALATDADGVVVNLYDAGTARLTLRDGTSVALATQTEYPSSGDIEITVTSAAKTPFAIKLRIPGWCEKAGVQVNGRNAKGKTGADGYLAIQRLWRDQDKIQLHFKIKPRILIGDHKNEGKLAVLYGPLVLAADAAASGAPAEKAPGFSIPGSDPNKLRITAEAAPDKVEFWPGARVFRVADGGTNLAMRLVPFADAGATGADYQIWLPFGPPRAGRNLLLNSLESRSREGNISSITK
jgi:hypothetical protein